MNKDLCERLRAVFAKCMSEQGIESLAEVNAHGNAITYESNGFGREVDVDHLTKAILDELKPGDLPRLAPAPDPDFAVVERRVNVPHIVLRRIAQDAGFSGISKYSAGQTIRIGHVTFAAIEDRGSPGCQAAIIGGEDMTWALIPGLSQYLAARDSAEALRARVGPLEAELFQLRGEKAMEPQSVTLPVVIFRDMRAQLGLGKVDGPGMLRLGHVTITPRYGPKAENTFLVSATGTTARVEWNGVELHPVSIVYRHAAGELPEITLSTAKKPAP